MTERGPAGSSVVAKSSGKTPGWARVVVAVLAALLVRDARPVPVPPDLRRALAAVGEETLDPARMGGRELRRLPGIGDRRAVAVLAARRRARESGEALDWQDIEGIGPKTDARVRAWIRAHGGDATAPLVP